MKVVGIIPARYASTRFPGKPLALIAGKPLIRHVVERCQQANSLADVIVATDDTRIWEVAQHAPFELALVSLFLKHSSRFFLFRIINAPALTISSVLAAGQHRRRHRRASLQQIGEAVQLNLGVVRGEWRVPRGECPI